MKMKAEKRPRDSRAFRGTVDHRNWVVLSKTRGTLREDPWGQQGYEGVESRSPSRPEWQLIKLSELCDWWHWNKASDGLQGPQPPYLPPILPISICGLGRRSGTVIWVPRMRLLLAPDLR